MYNLEIIDKSPRAELTTAYIMLSNILRIRLNTEHKNGQIQAVVKLRILSILLHILHIMLAFF